MPARLKRIAELWPYIRRLLKGLSGGQRFAQLLNRGVKSASLARVILVPPRQSGHLSLESLQPRDGFDDDADACGWSNAGHKLAIFWEIVHQLTALGMALSSAV
jgi:hypothetical protein